MKAIIRLHELFPRICLSPYSPVGHPPGYQPIPGFTGPVEQVSVGPNTAYVAGAGGAVRLRLVNAFDSSVPFDGFVFDPTFFGGGHIAAPDDNTLIVTPGKGGGGIMAVVDLRTITVVNHLIPYGDTFRGGVKVTTADVNRDGVGDVVCLPESGGRPRVVALDYRTGDVLTSFFAAPENSPAESRDFLPAGAGVEVHPGVLGVYLFDPAGRTFAFDWGGTAA